MADLHPKQKIILKLLKQNIDNPLSMLDISNEAEISSPGVFYHHLRQLEKKGYIKLNPENPRDYIIMDEPEKAIVYINKYGTAQCGPNGSILEGKPIERLPIPSFLLKFPAIEAFIVEAKGNSMEPKIHSGDTLIAKKQKHAEHGDIVVCVLNEKVLVKQYLLVQKKLVLYSLNEEYKLIEIKGDFHIEGVIKNILH